MPRYKLGARVTGPYYCEARKKWRIFIYDGPKPMVLCFDTEKAARKGLSQATKELRSSASRILGDVLAEYFAEKEQREAAKSKTCKDQDAALRRLLTSYLNDDIGRMTPSRASELYAKTTETPTRKTGKPPSAASHRFYLALA